MMTVAPAARRPVGARIALALGIACALLAGCDTNPVPHGAPARAGRAAEGDDNQQVDDGFYEDDFTKIDDDGQSWDAAENAATGKTSATVAPATGASDSNDDEYEDDTVAATDAPVGAADSYDVYDYGDGTYGTDDWTSGGDDYDYGYNSWSTSTSTAAPSDAGGEAKVGADNTAGRAATTPEKVPTAGTGTKEQDFVPGETAAPQDSTKAESSVIMPESTSSSTYAPETDAAAAPAVTVATVAVAPDADTAQPPAAQAAPADTVPVPTSTPSATASQDQAGAAQQPTAAPVPVAATAAPTAANTEPDTPPNKAPTTAAAATAPPAVATVAATEAPTGTNAGEAAGKPAADQTFVPGETAPPRRPHIHGCASHGSSHGSSHHQRCSGCRCACRRILKRHGRC